MVESTSFLPLKRESFPDKSPSLIQIDLKDYKKWDDKTNVSGLLRGSSNEPPTRIDSFGPVSSEATFSISPQYIGGPTK